MASEESSSADCRLLRVPRSAETYAGCPISSDETAGNLNQAELPSRNLVNNGHENAFLPPISSCVDLPIATLEKWFQAYQDEDYDVHSKALDAVQEDVLDHNAVERHILALSSSMSSIQWLCCECEKFFETWPELDAITDANRVVGRCLKSIPLEATARRGCRFCGFLLQVLNNGQTLDTARKVEARISVIQTLTANADVLRAKLDYATHSRESRGFIMYPASTSVAAGFTWIQLPPKNHPPVAAPRSSLSIAADWLSNCTENHRICSAKHDTNRPLPTRLISTEVGKLRLVLTESWCNKPLYTTLSHCWGKDTDFIQLTKANRGAFMKSISESELPKTFSDALHITRRFGIKYLWIDSLCIMQNDDEDWRKEAGRMCSVYSGSHLNLAAYSAKNPHGGCLIEPPTPVDGLRVSVKPQGSFKDHNVVQFECPPRGRMAIDESHLATRAWVFQETFLSPRTLYLGDRGAFWACESLSASESLPDVSLSSSLYYLMHAREDRKDFWNDIVRKYTAADLTLWRDKLPAFSGVARAMSTHFQCEYLAGLWYDDTIERQLCWRTHYPQQLRSRPPYRAPSWSWAAVNGPVIGVFLSSSLADRLKSVKMCRVVSAEIVPLDCNGESDPFGQVSGGWLRIAISYMLFLDGKVDTTHALHGNCNASVADYVDCYFDSSDDQKHKKEEVLVLPVLEQRVPGVTERMVTIEGLLIIETGAIAGQFRRIGYFRTLYREGKNRFFAHLLERRGEKLAREKCQQVLEDEYRKFPFVVTLV